MSLNLDKSEWETVRFGDIIKNVADRVDDPASAGVDRYVGLEHLDAGSLDIARWGAPTDVEAQKLRFAPGDIIFGRRRAYQKKVGYAEFDGICSAHALVLRAIPGNIEPAFLPFFIASDYFLDRAIAISVGSLSPTVNWRDLVVQEFALPPLPEQRRLADLLWAAEHHRRALNELISEARAVEARAYRVTADNSKTVNDFVLAARAGGTPSRKRSDFFGGGIPWLKSGEVVGDWITSTEETITEAGFSGSPVSWVEPGAVLVAMYGDGGTRGQVARAGVRMTTNQAVLALTPDPSKVDPDYFYFWLQTRQESLRNRSAGAAQKNLSKVLVLEEQFPDVPLDEQASVVAVVKKLRTANEALRREMSSTDAVVRTALLEVFG